MSYPTGTINPITPEVPPLFWANAMRRGGQQDVIVRSIVWDIESAVSSGRVSGTAEMAMRKLTNPQRWELVEEIRQARIPASRFGLWLNKKFDPDADRVNLEQARVDMVSALLRWDRAVEAGQQGAIDYTRSAYWGAVNRFAYLYTVVNGA